MANTIFKAINDMNKENLYNMQRKFIKDSYHAMNYGLRIPITMDNLDRDIYGLDQKSAAIWNIDNETQQSKDSTNKMTDQSMVAHDLVEGSRKLVEGQSIMFEALARQFNKDIKQLQDENQQLKRDLNAANSAKRHYDIMLKNRTREISEYEEILETLLMDIQR